jgi:hypothetical protein
MRKLLLVSLVLAVAVPAVASIDPYVADLEARHQEARSRGDRTAASAILAELNTYWANRNVIESAEPITLDPNDRPVITLHNNPPTEPQLPDWGWDIEIYGGTITGMAADEDVITTNIYTAVAYNSGPDAIVETHMSTDGGATWSLVTTYTWAGHTVSDIDLQVLNGPGVDPTGVYVIGVFDDTIIRFWATALGGGSPTRDVQVVADSDPKRHVRFTTDHETYPDWWYPYAVWEQDLGGNPATTNIIYFYSDTNMTWGFGPLYPFDDIGASDWENPDIYSYRTSEGSINHVVCNSNTTPKDVYWNIGYSGFDPPDTLTLGSTTEDFAPTVVCNNSDVVPEDVTVLWVTSDGTDDYITGAIMDSSDYVFAFLDTVLHMPGVDLGWPSLSDVIFGTYWGFSCLDNTGTVYNMSSFTFGSFPNPAEQVSYQHPGLYANYRPVDCVLSNFHLGPGTAWMASTGAYWSAGALGVDDEVTLPTTTALHAVYPNPFNPTASVAFDLPTSATVRLDVFDALGRRVTRLHDGELPAGSHSVTFDAEGLASGIYLFRLNVDGESFTRRAVLLK